MLAALPELRSAASRRDRPVCRDEVQAKQAACPERSERLGAFVAAELAAAFAVSAAFAAERQGNQPDAKDAVRRRPVKDAAAGPVRLDGSSARTVPANAAESLGCRAWAEEQPASPGARSASPAPMALRA